VPGFTYGGLLASLIDCLGPGTAAAAMYRAEGREMDTPPGFRFVTGSLHVDFLKAASHPFSGFAQGRFSWLVRSGSFEPGLYLN